MNTIEEEEIEEQLKEDDLFVTEENEIEDTIKDDIIPEIPNIKVCINSIFLTHSQADHFLGYHQPHLRKCR